ncbi:MAG TPA: hypothetical protein VM165_14230 [Planctomycetaceae bacterium]|nr:hypothetical protein [Planctomycetaceae bacterium]
MPVSTLVRSVRTPSRTIVLFTVRSGDRVVAETLDPLEAIRQRRSWNTVTEDFFEPATITMREFASVGEAVTA